MTTATRKTTKAKRKVFPKPDTKGQPEYIFIENGKVVATALDLDQAVKVYLVHPEAIAFEASRHQGVSELRGWQRRLRQHRSERDNPVARVLCDLSNDLVLEIENGFRSVVDYGSMGDSFNSGRVRVNFRKYRLATNRECADWKDGMSVNFCFDIRKDLPKQVSRWFRSVAGKLLKAADVVSKVPDTRNKAYLERLVNGEALIADEAEPSAA